jgi:hypothetical protein
VSAERAGTTAGGDGSNAPLPSDPAELERAIERHRAHLASTVDELTARTRPKEIARRTRDGASARLRAATTTPDGQLRKERIGAVAAAVAVLTGLAVWRRRRSG